MITTGERASTASLIKKLTQLYRGVAQMVARLVRDQEAVGSNPATPTTVSRGEDSKPERA